MPIAREGFVIVTVLLSTSRGKLRFHAEIDRRRNSVSFRAAFVRHLFSFRSSLHNVDSVVIFLQSMIFSFLDFPLSALFSWRGFNSGVNSGGGGGGEGLSREASFCFVLRTHLFILRLIYLCLERFSYIFIFLTKTNKMFHAISGFLRRIFFHKYNRESKDCFETTRLLANWAKLSLIILYFAGRTVFFELVKMYIFAGAKLAGIAS